MCIPWVYLWRISVRGVCGLSGSWTRAGTVPTLTVALGGQFAALRGEGYPGGRGGGTRGEVRGFSRESRKRLIDLIHQVDRSALRPPLFVTLTYPGEWPSDWQEYKRDLHNWLRRLARRYPAASVIWRLEFQKRGAAHYHVLVFGVTDLPKDWLSASWYEVVASGDVRHLAAGTQVATVHTWRGASFYCAKYLGKLCEFGTVDTGRCWGVRGDLPVELVEVALSWREFHQVRRVFRHWYERTVGREAWWCSQRGAGITAYLPEGEVARVLAWAVGTSAG